MYIKIAVLNNSGNVGKSTICSNLLQPRIEGSEIVKVETINSDGTSDETLSAKEFISIMEKIEDTDAAIIDIGASNIEIFMDQIKQYKGSHEDIDFYIVPIVPGNKQQTDSINTIQNLLDTGVEEDSIKIIFNFADKTIPIQKQYSTFFNDPDIKSFLKGLSDTDYSVIYETELFGLLNSQAKSFFDAVNDIRDFKTLIRSTEDREERSRLTADRAIKRLASGVQEDFDIAFSNLDII